MGQGGSKPEDVAQMAKMVVDYKPPLGAPNPVSVVARCEHRLCAPAAPTPAAAAADA